MVMNLDHILRATGSHQQALSKRGCVCDEKERARAEGAHPKVTVLQDFHRVYSHQVESPSVCEKPEMLWLPQKSLFSQ